ncbi:hypothetical protein UlMin_024175 [Ulmus minor]
MNWTLQQFDVKNAFLHGDLDEEVYMEIPPGVNNKMEGKIGYKQSQGDHILFIKHKAPSKLTALIRLKYFLGIEVAYSKAGVILSQRKYTLDLLKETGMLGSKPADSPIEPNHKLGDDPEKPKVDKERYQRLVGRLIYLSHIRPDIAYALIWIRLILTDLGVKLEGPMKLYCDNISAISIAHNPVQHDRTKHVEIDRHFIKEKLENGVICIPYVTSEGQLADFLTKGLSSPTFHSILSKMGMEDIFSPA